jgi:predicted HTH domain antitoxin
MGVSEMLEAQTLVDARLYPNQEAVIQDALRSLLDERPQLRVELAIYRYQTEELSLAKAAHLAGLSYDRMRELLVQRGIQPRLGPADLAEARREVAAMEQIVAGRKAR